MAFFFVKVTKEPAMEPMKAAVATTPTSHPSSLRRPNRSVNENAPAARRREPERFADLR